MNKLTIYRNFTTTKNLKYFNNPIKCYSPEKKYIKSKLKQKETNIVSNQWMIDKTLEPEYIISYISDISLKSDSDSESDISLKSDSDSERISVLNESSELIDKESDDISFKYRGERS